jgi:hypothetical protein
MSKILKSWIRSNKDRGCPFGLPISESCKNAGNSAMHMCPLESISPNKQDRVMRANGRVYLYYKTGDRCVYAANIIDDKNVVNCDFGDTGAGLNVPAMSGSPLYAQTFAGIGLDGLYAFPLGFYADNNESRNLFQGLFSLVGAKAYQLIKNADYHDVEIKNIFDKVSNGESLNTEERLILIQAIENCRENYEDNRTDSSKAYELSEIWNSRKRL